MDNQIWLWIGFNLFILIMLALDLGVFHRKAHEIKFKEAISWSAVWIVFALIFNAGIYHFMGAQKGTEFLTGYLIEKVLSVDNIFVFVGVKMMIVDFYKIPVSYSLAIILLILVTSIISSIAIKPSTEKSTIQN